MDSTIPIFYKSYGQYVNSFRSFPREIDGLKPVERRLLLTAHLVARDSFVKNARIEGTCMAKFHPHTGAYGTIVQLVDQGFLDGQGNLGFKFGVEPIGAAASRYTECKISENVENLAFKYINHVDFVKSELDDEPTHLPTMFPFCLMGKEITQGIGFGFRTVIPCYTIEDLHKRLIWLVKKDTDRPTIKPITNCIIDSSDTVLEELLTTGKAKVDIHGVLISNRALCKAIVKSWPPGRRFEAILNKFKEETDNKDIGYMDLSTEKKENGEGGTNIVFTVLKQRNRDLIFDNFIKKLTKELKGSISFEIILSPINEEGIIRDSVDNMLLKTYNSFMKTNERMLNYEINKTASIIDELTNLAKIKEPLAIVLQSGPITKDNISQKIEEVSRLSGVESNNVKELMMKYHIHKLFTINTDASSVKQKHEEFKASLADIENFVLNQYNKIK